MVGWSVHKLLRTWLGLLIIVLKGEESACAAFSLKEGVIWKESSPFGPSDEAIQAVKAPFAREPHQAGEPYINRSLSRLLAYTW